MTDKTDKQQTMMEAMQDRIAELEDMVRSLLGRQYDDDDDYVSLDDLEPTERPDYVPHGSDKHACMLGLKKADETSEYECKGWTLEDITIFGSNTRPEFLEAVLQQKVNSLTMSIPAVQSVDPRLPNFAPVIWTPDIPLSQLTERPLRRKRKRS